MIKTIIFVTFLGLVLLTPHQSEAQLKIRPIKEWFQPIIHAPDHLHIDPKILDELTRNRHPSGGTCSFDFRTVKCKKYHKIEFSKYMVSAMASNDADFKGLSDSVKKTIINKASKDPKVHISARHLHDALRHSKNMEKHGGNLHKHANEAIKPLYGKFKKSVLKHQPHIKKSVLKHRPKK